MADQGQTQGFGHSPRRMAAELGLLFGGLVVLIVGGYWAVSSTAGWLVTQLPVSLDTQLGEASYGMLAPEDKRCTNPAIKAYVEQLAGPLVEVAGAPFPFRFEVVDDDAINAFALPGGFVAINRGLLVKAKTAEEVAGVLAHELQHAIQRHGMRRIAREIGVAASIGLVLGWLDVQGMTAAAVSLVGRSYDRDQEAEADRLGRALLLQAGIHPDGMATFFERLAQEGPSLPALISTHPDSGERARLAREGPKFEGRPRKLPPPQDWPCHADK